MGQEIEKVEFNNYDFSHFKRKLKQETLLLKQWFLDKAFKNEGHSMGVELEAWLTDKNLKPKDNNLEFLKKLDHHQVVTELCKYNIEINGSPHVLEKDIFLSMENELEQLWMNVNKRLKI